MTSTPMTSTPMTSTPLRTSPLDDRHRALGATLTGFAGWDMPLDYGSVVAEHTAVRTSCGVFDLSHLGTLRVTGPSAEATLQGAFTNDVAALTVGRAHYTLCLDTEAGIIDDLLVYRLGGEDFLVVPNAANAAHVEAGVRAVMAAAAHGPVEVDDVKAELACLAVQGPDAPTILAAAGVEVEGMDYLDVRYLVLDGEEAGLLARSGYTGEVGWEVFVRAQLAGGLWDAVLAAGATPAGLGARDTLRLEMGYPLHGQDISRATTPVEAGLSWAVKPGTGFLGEDAYVAAVELPAARRLRGLRVTGRGIPRAHCAISDAGGAEVGETTSGTFSPTLRVGLAMGYLDAALAPGDAVEIEVRGKRLPAEIVKPPFVDSSPRG